MQGILRKAGKLDIVESDDYAGQRFGCPRRRSRYIKATGYWRNHIHAIRIDQANFYLFVSNFRNAGPNLRNEIEMWNLLHMNCIEADSQGIYFVSDLCIITNEREVDVHEPFSSTAKQTLVGATPLEVRVNSTIVFLGAS